MDSDNYNTDSSDNEDKQISLLHLMYAIACEHSSTRATSLMRVKNSMHQYLLMRLIVWDIRMKKMIERSKTSN